MSDAVLLQYLHDELAADERGRVEEQLTAMPAVARRLDTLRRRSDLMSGLLRTLDPAPSEIAASRSALQPLMQPDAPSARPALTHPRWWRRPALQAAAAIALLLGAVLLVEPVRAWVVERARAVIEAAGLVNARPDDASAPATTDADAAAAAAAAPARFTVTWTGTVIEIDAGSAAGTLVVVRGPEGRVSAEIAAGDAAAITFVPGGLRIAGEGTTETIYTLVLPPSVQSLRLSHSGRTITHAVAGASELRLPLR